MWGQKYQGSFSAMFAHGSASRQPFPVVWIFLRSLGVICYGRWILSVGHKNYFKDWCLINPYLFLTYLNLWIMAIHGSEKLGWLFLHDFIKNFGKYQTFRHCLIICMFGVILHPLWGPKWHTQVPEVS